MKPSGNTLKVVIQAMELVLGTDFFTLFLFSSGTSFSGLLLPLGINPTGLYGW